MGKKKWKRRWWRRRRRKRKNRGGLKNGSTSGGHISAKSQPIFKNYMSFGIAKEFPIF
jgi:hypothetical protein